MNKTSIAVVGTGYVGMTAALALAGQDRQVTCIGTLEPSLGDPDTRSTALFPDSVAFLETAGVWPLCQAESRPLAGIRIVDGTGSILRAPEVTFRADDVGLDALAVNIPNKALHRALVQAIQENSWINVLDGGRATSITHLTDGIRVSTEDGDAATFDLLIAADGRNSIARKAAGIGTRTWAYEQTALALRFTHSAPHEDISTEFHRAAGPFTTVPGPDAADGHTSHLVWIETPGEAKRIAGLADDAFVTHLEDELQGLLGHIITTGPRKLFPICGQTASIFAANNTFLVGEAAHVMPPIGAQGMNLGFRDVAGLVRCLTPTTSVPGKDIDVDKILAAYNKDRRQDVWMRTTAVDLLNRSLTTPYWPVWAMRGAGLHMLNALPSLKRATIRAGFGH